MSNKGIEELKALREKRQELAKEITSKAKTLFKEASATLFEEFPNLVKFGWTAYTPYFNDGDVCEYSSHHDSPYITFTTTKEAEGRFSPYDFEFSDYNYCTFNSTKRVYEKRTDLTPEQEAEYITGKAVVDFLGNFDDDDMLSMFGDHILVSVTKDGVETEEYDHD